MQQALRLAQKAADCGEVPVGALIVNAGDQCIAESYNQSIGLCDPTAHAEILSLRAAAQFQQNYRLPDTTLYCTLEPCAMCAGALIQARVKRVVFGAFDQKAGAAGSVFQILNNTALNHQIIFEGNILPEASVDLLQAFFRERRRFSSLKNLKEK